MKQLQHLFDVQTLARLVGDSAPFQSALRNLPAVARGDATVLITGETGTGKELVARAIHYLSGRASEPFLPVNCGSIPDTLLEEELFGHERGAFTDAHAGRPGLIAQANGGTFFLDEVDALTLRAQVALLRVLQDKTFRPIGSRTEQSVDVRIIAATNSELDELVRQGLFRADLYYRIRILSIHLPPLRDRIEDIPALAEHFVRKHASEDRGPVKLADTALVAMRAHTWPGNVRELENAIIRGLAYSETDSITPQDLDLAPPRKTMAAAASASGGGLGPMRMQKQQLVEAFERDYLAKVIAEHHGNVAAAARTAGKERRELGKLLRKYNLDPKDFTGAA